MAQKKHKILEAKYFAFLIGFIVFLLCLGAQWLTPLKMLDYAVLDTHFNFRIKSEGYSDQVNVLHKDFNPNVSSDIIIAGIDTSSLARFGKWPWPRYRHADFLNSLSRIKNQNERENSVLLDIFFIEPSTEAENDSQLLDSIKENGRVFQETILDNNANDVTSVDEMNLRQLALMGTQAPITAIKGPTAEMQPFYGTQPPLLPLALASAGYGHPTFKPDEDNTYRRQILIAKYSQLKKIIRFDDLKPDFTLNPTDNERLAWFDKKNFEHPIPYPLNAENLATLKNDLELNAPKVIEDDGSDPAKQTGYFIVYQYKDLFLPAITLSLALHYFHKTAQDLDIKMGEYIKIPKPEHFNSDAGAWEPYKIEVSTPQYDDNNQLIKEAVYRDVPEIVIPIDNQGAMLINFMGPQSSETSDGYQTFTIRSYASYASRITSKDPSTWPASLKLGNKIIMAGAFSQGGAADEKKSPFGLMYGIEMHANALNTIIMDKFIHPVPPLISLLFILIICMLVAFFASRLNAPFTILVTAILSIVYFFVASILFDISSVLVDFALPIFGMFLTMIAVIAYRVMTEEREKKAIHSMFGKYVSRDMVDQMVAYGAQPELGGVDKELTVLFSDIRGFTTLSESLTPQELVNHLNTYLTAMTDIIMEYKGTLDKYVGDEIMCFWGAPLPEANHAFLACQCALRQMEKLAELNTQWPPEKRIDIGIGVNSGIMTVGNMGSLGRMNYTLMGDNVNLGARLEGTNKEYGSHIIISEYTYGLVKNRVVVRELDNIRVKGKNKPVLIYELIDVIADNS